MDVKYINPFLLGTVEVLKKMAGLTPTADRIYLKTDDLAQGDISGIIGITGDAIGSLAVSFSESCICNIVGNMLGETFVEATRDVFDAVGELTNMISGVARSHLQKDGLSVYAAIPSIVYGKNHTINHILQSPSLIIPFTTDAGSFVVDVCIRRLSEQERKHSEYGVKNVRTLQTETVPVSQAPQPPLEVRSEPVQTGPLEPQEKILLLKKKLAETLAARDAMHKELAEKPFMDLARRKLYQKNVPIFDAKIRRLKLDITALQTISNLQQEDLDNPKLVKHYQHHTPKR